MTMPGRRSDEQVEGFFHRLLDRLLDRQWPAWCTAEVWFFAMAALVIVLTFCGK